MRRFVLATVASAAFTAACGSPTPPSGATAPADAATDMAADAATADSPDAAAVPDTAPLADADALADDVATDSADVGPGKAVPIDQFIQAMAAAVCKAMATCPESMFGEARFAQAAGCEAFVIHQALASEVGKFAAKVKGGKVLYDAVKAGVCVHAFATQCDLAGKPKPQGACADTFKGTVANDVACDVDEECVSRYCKAAGDQCPMRCAAQAAVGEPCTVHDGCLGALLCVAGKCSDKKVAAAGEPCADLPCAPGLGCYPKGSFDTCEPKTESGGCGEHFNCKPGFHCSKGMCTSNAAEGKACGAEGGGCGPDFVCVVAVGSQLPGTCGEVRKVGEACNSVSECGFLDRVCAGATYDTKSGAKQGKCATWPKKGAACSDSPGLTSLVSACEPPWQCSGVTKTCGEPFPQDSACKQDANCQAGLQCHAGVCKVPLGSGAVCKPFGGVPCQKGLTCQASGGEAKCLAPVCPGP